MLKRIANALLKGARTIGVVAAGGAITALIMFLKSWEPTGIAGAIWTLVGVTVVTGALASVLRLIGYDPNKDPAVVGPLVPVTTLAEVPAARKR